MLFVDRLHNTSVINMEYKWLLLFLMIILIKHGFIVLRRIWNPDVQISLLLYSIRMINQNFVRIHFSATEHCEKLNADTFRQLLVKSDAMFYQRLLNFISSFYFQLPHLCVYFAPLIFSPAPPSLLMKFNTSLFFSARVHSLLGFLLTLFPW